MLRLPAGDTIIRGVTGWRLRWNGFFSEVWI